MKEFDETMQSIFEKSDALIARRNRRRTIIRRIGAVAAELSAAAVICIGLAKSDALRSGMEKDPGRDFVAITTAALTEPSETVLPTQEHTAAVTEAVTESFHASQETVTTKAAKTEEMTASASSPKQTKKTSRPTAASAGKRTTAAARTSAVRTSASPVTTKAVTTRKPSQTTGNAVVTIARTTITTKRGAVECTMPEPTEYATIPPSILTPTTGGGSAVTQKPATTTRPVTRESIEWVLKHQKYTTTVDDEEAVYTAVMDEPPVDPNILEGKICDYTFKCSYYSMGWTHWIYNKAEIYSVKNFDSAYVVAVKFEGFDGYYLYQNEKRHIGKEFGLFLSDMYLDENWFSTNIYYYSDDETDVETHKAAQKYLKELLEEMKPCTYDDFHDRGNTEKVVLTYFHPILSIKHTVTIYSTGVIEAETFGSLYYIDEERAKEIINEIRSFP